MLADTRKPGARIRCSSGPWRCAPATKLPVALQLRRAQLRSAIVVSSWLPAPMLRATQARLFAKENLPSPTRTLPPRAATAERWVCEPFQSERKARQPERMEAPPITSLTKRSSSLGGDRDPQQLRQIRGADISGPMPALPTRRRRKSQHRIFAARALPLED